MRADARSAAVLAPVFLLAVHAQVGAATALPALAPLLSMRARTCQARNTSYDDILVGMHTSHRKFVGMPYSS